MNNKQIAIKLRELAKELVKIEHTLRQILNVKGD